MDPTTQRLVAALAIIVVLAVLLRRRYGNIYDGLKQTFERATGLGMASVVRGLGILTLVVWALVYVFFGGEEETGLEQLFQRVLGGSEQSEAQ